MKYVITAAASLCLITFPLHGAGAHDVWSDGDPVPAWVKAQCCGPSDAHHLTAEQVHVTGEGYRLDGYSRLVRRSAAAVA